MPTPGELENLIMMQSILESDHVAGRLAAIAMIAVRTGVWDASGLGEEVTDGLPLLHQDVVRHLTEARDSIAKRNKRDGLPEFSQVKQADLLTHPSYYSASNAGYTP